MSASATQDSHKKQRRRAGLWKTRAYSRVYKGIYAPKLPKLYLTIGAEDVANLVNVNMWL